MIWALVVIVVLALILSVGLAMASAWFNANTIRHEEDQAYYTALSVTQSMAKWIMGEEQTGAGVGNDPDGFIDSVKASGSVGLTPTIPAELGTASVTVSYAAEVLVGDETMEQITIATTATFADQTRTVELALHPAAEGALFPTPVSDFDVTPSVEQAAQINGEQGWYAPDPTPINVYGVAGSDKYKVYGESGTQSVDLGGIGPTDSAWPGKRDFNAENSSYMLGVGNVAQAPNLVYDPTSNIGIPQLSNPIDSAAVTGREVTWLENENAAVRNEITGPRDMPYIYGEGRDIASYAPELMKVIPTARVTTALNGRFALNPINFVPGSSVSGGFNHAYNDTTNVKFAMYNIDDTAGKDIRIRLANGSGLQQNTNDVPFFAYIGLDLVDNKTDATNPQQIVEVPNVTTRSYEIPVRTEADKNVTATDVNGVAFYPNRWNSGLIYTSADPNYLINSELLFGNYNRIHYDYILDYRNWDNYVNYHYGAVNQQYDVLKNIPDLEYANLSETKDMTGYQAPPVYWGNDFSMYLLDGVLTDHIARIMQGVNIVNERDADGSAGGTVFSNRGLKIGGGLVYSGGVEGTDEFYDGLSTIVDGGDGNNDYCMVQMAQLGYHQVIKDTDIVLTASADKPKTSEICHPDSMNPHTGRTLTIEGGTIYVGQYHTLQIDSEVKDGTLVKRKIGPDGVSPLTTPYKLNEDMSSSIRYTETGNRMYIKPDAIVVDGGTLTILGNQNNPGQAGGHYNVETDIYVFNGGVLNIEANASIKGNIYCYGGGTVNVKGSFYLEGHTIDAGGEAMPGGIFIYGEHAADPVTLQPLGAGNFTAGAAYTIQGSDGLTSYTDGGHAVHFMSKTLFKPDVGNHYSDYACTDHDNATNACRHFDGGAPGDPGGWLVGDYTID